MIINARVQMAADALRALMTQVLREALTDVGVVYQTAGATALTPHVPTGSVAAV